MKWLSGANARVTPSGAESRYVVSSEAGTKSPVRNVTLNEQVLTRQALVEFYANTSGEGWKVNFGWLSLELRQWWGLDLVQQNTKPPTDIFGSDEKRRSSSSKARQGLTSIRLMGNSLRGTLPESIGTLSSLKHLCLQSNCGMCGSLPSSIGQLSHLRVLNLNWCSLNGTLPAALGKLSELEELHLRENSFSGHIPDTLGKCSQLRVLDLASNQISGEVPGSLGALKHLILLDLENNLLRGELPCSLLQLEGCEIIVGGNFMLAFPQSSNEKAVHRYQCMICPVAAVLEMTRLLPHAVVKQHLLQCSGYDREFIILSPAEVMNQEAETNSSHANDRSRSHSGSRSDRSSSGNELERYAHKKISRRDVAFISHRWASDAHPDDEHCSKLEHLKHFLRANPDVLYIWMDYLCIPQNECLERAQAIDALPSYVANCGRFVVLLRDVHCFQIYQQRAWCQLEMLLACLPPLALVEREMRAWDDDGWEGCSQIASIYDSGSMHERPLDELAGDRIGSPLDGIVAFESDRSRIAHVLLRVIESLPASIMNEEEKNSHKIRVASTAMVKGGNFVKLLPQVKGVHTAVNALKRARTRVSLEQAGGQAPVQVASRCGVQKQCIDEGDEREGEDDVEELYL